MMNILDMLGLSGGGASAVLNLAVYALMLALFVLGIAKCIGPVVHNEKLLKRAVRNIRAGQDAKRSWQEDRFLGKGTLYAHWSEYLNNLFFADGAYHNPSRVEDYINEETVIDGPGRSTFAEAIPGILVSLGFLGTLIGIAMGLSGFDMADSEAVQQSIVTLIPGMRYAFTTSIVGVVLSVSFNLMTRMANGAAVHALDSFYAAMSRYAGVLSVDPLTQLAIYQQEQTQMMRTMTEEISGRFARNVNQAIIEATEPMTQAFENFVTVSTQEQMRFLDRVVARFVDRMDASLSGQLTRLSQTLEKTAADQERMGQLSHDLLDLQDSTAAMLTKVKTYTDALTQNQNTADEVMEKVSSTLESIDIISRQQTSHLKNINTLQREMLAAMDEFRAASEAFMHQIHETSSRTAEGMHMASDELNASAAQLAKVQTEITGQINADLRDAFDSFEQYMAQFTQRIDQVADASTGAVRERPKAVGETGNQFLDEVDRLTETLHAANERIARAGDETHR